MEDEGLQRSDYDLLVKVHAEARTRKETSALVKAAVLRIGGLGIGGLLYGSVATKGTFGTVLTTVLGVGLGVGWNWIEANKDAHFAIWQEDQRELRRLKANIKAMETSASTAAPQRAPLTQEDRVIAQLRRLRCPGPRGWDGAQFLLEARDSIGRNIATQLALGQLAGLSWAGRHDPVLQEFQEFLLELDKLEVLKWPDRMDAPCAFGRLGQGVWLILQDEQAASGATAT